MTTHTPVIVLQSTRPDEVAAWKAEQDVLVAAFDTNLTEFQNALGASEVWYTTTTRGLQLTGWEGARPDADLPPGWRRDTKGERAIVPALRTKEGKVHAARMKDAGVVLPPAPGLPEAVWGEGFRGQFRIEQLNSRWYAWLGFNLKQDQTLVKAGVDLDYWFHAPLSRYHQDRETIARHTALSGAGTRS